MSGEGDRFGLKVVDYQPPAPPRQADDREWVAAGEDWRVWRSGDVLMLQYQSGEHGGGLRSIAIEGDELAGLQDGSLTADEVLRRHHAG